MITIPEYVYNDNTIEFVCPALELARDKAARMHAVLTDPNWPDVLDEKEYICHAMKKLGFNSTLISDTLSVNYYCNTLAGCLLVEMGGSRSTRIRVANSIRKAWCDHMRTYLSTALSRED